ncbi:ABC transporter ATP-binding protein [uncultured Sneathia sp.]|uniref:ABC transporter ATP-binding protein n=1 Tax=uncultured Sneathia sp. TaxID=278067 RepID=UPI0028039CD4|nr:ABC transporter ATP-binding protein [uncultured Sneathia sp.]
MFIYRKLFAYVKEKKHFILLAIFFSVVSAFLTVFAYYYIYKFLYDLIIQNKLENSKYLAIRTVVFLILGALAYGISGVFSHLVGFRLETNLRKKGIEGLSKSSFRFFDLNPSGKVRKILDDNAAQTHQAVAHMIPDSSQAFIIPILTMVLSFVVNIRVGIILVLLTIICGGILAAMMGESKFMEIYQKSLEKLSAESVEYVRGMQVIKIFGMKVKSFKNLYKSIKDYSKYAYDYSNSCKKAYVWYQWIFFGLILILIIPIVFMLPILGNLKVLLIDLIMTLFLSGVIFVSFMRIMWFSMYIFQANYAVDSLEKLYESMQKDKLEHGSLEKFENYDIEFANVTFSYDKKIVLKELSFKLESGKYYALVGSSGSGKSTIAKLISGFYRVDNGSIKIGGKSIEQYTEKSIVDAISFVFQDAKMFKISIFENVLLAKSNASREEVMNALHLAGCDTILEKFKDRENTIIGSKGVYLSGGEVQRIAIARAILKNSNIIILDEASASIDPENEYELQRALKNLINGKTVIMIAHRLTSIRKVDEILVIENGQIVERGSDKELMSKDTKYKKLQEKFDSANEWRVENEGVL